MAALRKGRFAKAAYVFTAVELARQWAHNNPEQAERYVDRATRFVDERTGHKHTSKLDGVGSMAKKSLIGGTLPSSTHRPDMRA